MMRQKFCAVRSNSSLMVDTRSSVECPGCYNRTRIIHQSRERSKGTMYGLLAEHADGGHTQVLVWSRKKAEKDSIGLRGLEPRQASNR